MISIFFKVDDEAAKAAETRQWRQLAVREAEKAEEAEASRQRQQRLADAELLAGNAILAREQRERRHEPRTSGTDDTTFLDNFEVYARWTVSLIVFHNGEYFGQYNVNLIKNLTIKKSFNMS